MSQRISAACLGAMLLFCAFGAFGEEPQAAPEKNLLELVREARTARAANDFAGFRDAMLAIHQRRPNNSDYMYQLVLAHALVGDRTAAYSLMLEMQQQGLSYDFNATEDSTGVRGTQAYDHINELLVRQGDAAGESELLFELPANLLLPTAVAWDESRKLLLVGAAREGTVHTVSMDGEVREILRGNTANGMWGVFGLLVDAPNNRLWVSSAASPVTVGYDKADAGRSALFEFKLDSLELVKSYPVSVDGKPHRLGGLVRVPSGDIYAVDTVLPIIYKLAAGAEAIQPFVASGDMVSLRGIASSADGNKLYVADYEMGIMVLDMAQRQVSLLSVPTTFNEGGIEGLFYWNNHLVVIQNGIKPQRIMRLKLEDDGVTVKEVAPLAIARPEFDYPNFGSLVGDELVFLANSHWVQTAQQQPAAVRVAKTNVSEAAILAPPDMQKYLEKQQKRDAESESAGKDKVEGQSNDQSKGQQQP